MDKSLAAAVLGAAVLAAAAGQALSQGVVLRPVSRGPAWKYAFDAPVSCGDNALWFGGLQGQWPCNEARCGGCGDDFSLQRPRLMENTGIVVATCTRGQTFRASVKLVSNNRGYLVFKLCPVSGPRQLVTQACFDSCPLAVQGSDGYKYYLANGSPEMFEVNLRLPSDVSSQRCVLQWTYAQGNNWGRCSDVAIEPERFFEW